ncbi:Delta 12 fatty acid desaturase [Phaffia rhodozyma]|uniref:Delta 12 fatty acid desaturase n=1 Tax=Phaffia rhodozyma TaxID=264483 RepID=A0A0F7SXQ6_PHARH|nr:Delta 12 fatty acid desaturase [Phaffia rhodozyma]
MAGPTTTTASTRPASAVKTRSSKVQPSTGYVNGPNGTHIQSHEKGQAFKVPEFTVKQLLDAIPAHCFHRSAIKSLRYVVQDLAIYGSFSYAAWHIPTLLTYLDLPYWPNLALKVVLYNVYWFAAGCIGMGIWVLAHEAGHGAFSESKILNDIVGWIFHSIWMVPYHSWRISHGKHHAACGSATRDEVFAARTRSDRKLPAFNPDKEDFFGMEVSEDRQHETHSAITEAFSDAPIVVLARLIGHQIFGLPLYLIINASGQKHYGWSVNHFLPSSKIFKSRDFWDIIWSDVGIATVIGIMVYWSKMRSWQEMATFWLVPYMWVNHWLVLITFLQHTDPLIPHYSNETWNFSRGALATVDRNVLGFVGAYLQHGISETHICHHVSSKIPHYNAWEATEALKVFLGEHYVYSTENVFVSLWKNFQECQFVEDGADYMFYKNRHGLAKTFPHSEKGSVSDSAIELEDPEDGTKAN